MLSIPDLRARVELGDGHVVVRHDGRIVEMQVPEDFGPAVLLVAPVTDALKKVSPDGLVEGSVDRGSILQVEGIALDAATIAGLDEDELQMAPLICAVIANGVELDARPAASLLRSQLGPP